MDIKETGICFEECLRQGYDVRDLEQFFELRTLIEFGFPMI